MRIIPHHHRRVVLFREVRTVTRLLRDLRANRSDLRRLASWEEHNEQ
ncbi:MAG TPA: hypothetical protein VNJ04_07620 [Gemmatimonadaceae bacterium]|nr:hypothetical protein [Gemmatimonadaceae bacterium]